MIGRVFLGECLPPGSRIHPCSQAPAAPPRNRLYEHYSQMVDGKIDGALPHKESTRKRFVASDKKVLEGCRTPSPACQRQGGRRRWPYQCARGKRSPGRWRGATCAPVSASAG